MLFDEKDLNVFASEESKQYFKDILQTYYSQNYRATVVLLYSFLVYDLYEKLKSMANEGNSDAKKTIEEIKKDFADEIKYSEIEKKIISYFENNYSFYFKNIKSDIDYLTDCRHNCAHLNINDDKLYIPKDYQVRMLIISMYDNIFSIKAPFITDLFSYFKNDIETISSNRTVFNEDFYNKLETSKFSRMTDESIKKTLKSFVRMLFLSEDQDAIKNAYGFWGYTYALSKYAMSRGLDSFFTSDTFYDYISKIDYEKIKEVPDRKSALNDLFLENNAFRRAIKNKNAILFNQLIDDLLGDSFSYKDNFQKLSGIVDGSKYSYFIANHAKIRVVNCKYLYDFLCEDPNFNVDDFTLLLLNKVPTYNGFQKADDFMDYMMSVFSILNEKTIKNIFKKYISNEQFLNRRRHELDIKKIVKINKEMATPVDLKKIAYFFDEIEDSE